MKHLILSSLLVLLGIWNLSAQEWLSDLPTAEKLAAETNKKIVLVFQGSDWCAPCIKLEREIWSSAEFKEYAKEHFILLLADFPRKKKNQLSKEQQSKNEQLAEKYDKQGYFPCVLVLDKSGQVLGTTGYKNLSPAQYIKLLASF